MDNTELHYLTYDPDAIWLRMQENYVEAGGDILYPGDEKEMLLRSVLADIVQVFAGVDNALRMQTLRYAVGEYLDVLGELRGCERIKASNAQATVSITTNATGEATVLPAGTVMTADGEVFYALDEDIALTGYQQTLSATIKAVQEGTEGNYLAVGTEMVLYIGNPAVFRIVVTTAAAGGDEEEEDDVYRERIRQHMLTSVTTGTASQYETVAKQVSSDVIDVLATSDGTRQSVVMIYLIIAEDADSQSVMSAVGAAVRDPGVRPLTDTVFVEQATAKPYTLNVEYTSDGSSAVSSAVAAAVSEYKAWQDNKIGQPFNPDRLMAALYQAGVTRVVWGAGSNFDDGDVQYTEIEHYERCLGIITLTETSS